MYEEFYGLTHKPFAILPDPRFMYWGRTHQLAYTMMEYGLSGGAGLTVVTGEIGCGKTTLIRNLLNSQDQSVVIGLISNTKEVSSDLLSWVLYSFDQPYEQTSKVAKFDALQRFLIDQYSQGKRVVLIVDEAQNLSPGTLEELRMLTNINAEQDLLLQIILVGQPQLRTLLKRPELAQFAQRVAADFNIRPLQKSEIGDYIAARLSAAGRVELLFNEAAAEKIYDYSLGVPRVINTMCDMCLVYGFSSETPIIDLNVVDEVLKDKEAFGVFGVESSKTADDTQTPVFETFSEGDGPALVINDRRLARIIIDRAYKK